ncbi:MAG: hypothetical protein GY798_32815 [Hyphomicrobiales bacterium]|nr:hypothetical protein [Hyphomicrobiales bacterium]
MRLFVVLHGLAVWLVLSVAGEAAMPMIEAGMTPPEVVAVLGEPDRVAVFEGKYLKDIPLDSAVEDARDGRFVLIYRDKDLKVWFADGKAASVEEGAGPATNLTRPANQN